MHIYLLRLFEQHVHIFLCLFNIFFLYTVFFMSDGRVQFNVNKVKLFNLSHVDDDDAVC